MNTFFIIKVKIHMFIRVVYTMDHEVVPGPCKSVDWLLNSSWDHFGLHQGKNGSMTMKVKVLKRHILRPA